MYSINITLDETVCNCSILQVKHIIFVTENISFERQQQMKQLFSCFILQVKHIIFITENFSFEGQQFEGLVCEIEG
jgi:hypothetical protein